METMEVTERLVKVTKHVPLLYSISADEFVPAEPYDHLKCVGLSVTYGERWMVRLRLSSLWRRWEIGRKKNVCLWPRIYRRYACGFFNVLVLNSAERVE